MHPTVDFISEEISTSQCRVDAIGHRTPKPNIGSKTYKLAHDLRDEDMKSKKMGKKEEKNLPEIYVRFRGAISFCLKTCRWPSSIYRLTFGPVRRSTPESWKWVRVKLTVASFETFRRCHAGRHRNGDALVPVKIMCLKMMINLSNLCPKRYFQVNL